MKIKEYLQDLRLRRSMKSAVCVSGGAVVVIDTDLLTKEQVAQIKQRMTPVFVEVSGRSSRRLTANPQDIVMLSPKPCSAQP